MRVQISPRTPFLDSKPYSGTIGFGKNLYSALILNIANIIYGFAANFVHTHPRNNHYPKTHFITRAFKSSAIAYEKKLLFGYLYFSSFNERDDF